MVEVFRTNVPGYGSHAQDIIKELSALLPGYRINFDLEDRDRILRIEGDEICPIAIIQQLRSHGFACSILD